MLDFTGLNWLAVLVATAASFALGWLWYGPMFGKAWMTAIGKTEDELKPSAQPFIISAVTALITCIVLAALLRTMGIDGLAPGATLGLITGVGFTAAAMASDAAFCGWGTRLWAIQAGYRVTYAVLMGAILGAWM